MLSRLLATLAVLAATATAGCAWNAILTPYPFRDAASAPPASVATVWGAADDTSMYLRKINGKGLPSRKGGGYPLSLTLLPGTYEIEVYFDNADNREAIFPISVTVEAGHTYLLEYKVIEDGGNGRVAVRPRDLGTSAQCHYERYKTVRGSAKLVCQ